MKISAALKGVNRLCIETAPFIYLIEQHPNYLKQMRQIFNLIDAGNIQAFSSAVTLTEVLTQPLKAGNIRLVQEYRAILLTSRNFTLISVDAVVADRAAELRAQYNLRTPDALQVALAVQSRCDAFLTNDNGLKRIHEIPACC